MKIFEVLKKAEKLVTPSKKEQEEMRKIVSLVFEKTKEIASKHGAKPLVAGSVTRNTWLPNKKEFDIFVMFDPSISREELEAKGLEIGKEVAKAIKGKAIIEYAEHPYVNIKYKDYEIDIVPCYELPSVEKIKSAVDRTPFHVRYLEKNLKKEMQKEVRLLKGFLKAIDAYGADIKTQGLSGYACELLIIHFKTFLNCIKEFAKMNFGMIIDIENYWQNKRKELIKMFKGHPLILIDPVDRKRNVASALSTENFFRIAKFSKQFLEKPSIKYFKKIEPKPYSLEKLKKVIDKRETKMFLIVFEKPDVVDDILYGQLRKFANRIESILEETKYEFVVFDKDFFVDENKNKVYVLLEMEVWDLPNIQKRIGPVVFDKVNSKRFLKQHEKALIKPYVENGRWVAIVKRKFKTAKEKIKDSLSKPEKILLAKGIPSHIAKSIAKDFKIYEESKIIKLAKNKEFNKFLVKYLEKSW